MPINDIVAKIILNDNFPPRNGAYKTTKAPFARAWAVLLASLLVQMKQNSGKVEDITLLSFTRLRASPTVIVYLNLKHQILLFMLLRIL